MSTTVPSQEMFTKIEDFKETQKIWADLAHRGLEVFAKIGESERIILLPQIHPGGQVFCTLKIVPSERTHSQGKIFLESLTGQDLLGQFSLAGDKYFFRTTWVHEDPFIIFPTEIILYKLQRRQNFRLKVPKAFHSEFVLESVNGKKTQNKVKIWDLSSRGCCLLVEPTSMFKANDGISGTMTLSKRSPVFVQGIVKHIRTEKVEDKVLRLAGVEFVPLGPALESQLFTVMMELSRLYLRIS
ncbi:MAG: PilZ domain-containing protein [Bdellovibrionaceae bacterium]|nr:PilZ domain-containing protein [Pseudobdellovibrionaceae bacterium]